MSYGLQIHRQAVMIEYYLNQAVSRIRGQRNCSLADITMVYDQPIRLTADILSELQDKVRNETELKTIGYQDKILYLSGIYFVTAR